MDKVRIAAVFATMNRGQTAVACVRALAAQTRPLEMVVVADNVSSDDTVALLEGLVDLPFELVVHRMPENAGNAGGVRAAMELAYAAGADAVWILDDDSWPRPDALAALMEHYRPELVVHPVQWDPARRDLTWPVQFSNGDGWDLAMRVDELPEGAAFPSRGGWTGAIISKRIHEAVGPVMGELFIRGEDEEYPWRIGHSGFMTMCVRGAVLDHPGPPRLVHWRLGRKAFFFEPGLSEWKLHYKVRNIVWLKKRESGATKAALTSLAYLIAVARWDGFAGIPVVLRAVWDGWRGRLGRLEP